ncbi:MAG: tetratricopeptide repeat protein, partial [Chloroflexota bacterium]
MAEQYLTVDDKIFVGRVEEQKQFRAALQEVRDPPPHEDLPYVCLLYGDGGMGKSTLVKRFCDIARQEEAFAGKFQFLWLDWEDERKKFPSLQVGQNQISEETVFETIYTAAIREKWGRQFVAYRKAVKQQVEAAEEVQEALESDEGWDELSILRAIGLDALASIISFRLPVIGASGQGLVEAFLEAGIQVGLEQAIRLRTTLDKHLRARLSDDHYEYLLNPHEQLARALGRGLNRVARRKRLIVVLDSYEIVDRVDLWMRVVIRSAGPRVMWIISDRNDLLNSRQFGDDYFKGYADDFPRRLLAYRMRPLAIAHIRTYFQARVPERVLDDQETEAISRVTRGIPLAVQVAAEIWKAGASLDEIIGDITGSTPGGQIVQKMTDRYLQHAVEDADREILFALALARGDVEILRAMLQPAAGETFDLEELLRRMERDYASVHATRARLHDDPALFFQEYLKSDIRRTTGRVQRLSQKAVEVLRARLVTLEEELPRLQDRCRDDNWVRAALDLAHYLFWLDENEAWRWLVTRYVESMAYSRDLRHGLLQIAREWKGNLSQSGERLLQVLDIGGPDEAVLLNVLEQLNARGWLDGPYGAERRAILRMHSAAQLLRHGRLRAALDLFEQVEEGLQDGQELLRRQLADAYTVIAARLIWPNGRYDLLHDDHAERILRKVLDWFPERQRAWYLLGNVLIAADQNDEALEALQRALEIDPQHAASHTASGDIHRAAGRADQARSDYQTALEIDQNSASAQAGLGALAYTAGDAQAALSAFQKALKFDPDCRPAMLGVGQICLDLRRFDDARQAFQKAMTFPAGRSIAYRGLGDAYRGLERADKAIISYRLAIREDPRDAAAFCGLGDAHYRGLGQVESAIPAYRQALTLDPALARARLGLGDIHRAAGELNQAIEQYELATTLDPHCAPAFYGLAQTYR